MTIGTPRGFPVRAPQSCHIIIDVHEDAAIGPEHHGGWLPVRYRRRERGPRPLDTPLPAG